MKALGVGLYVNLKTIHSANPGCGSMMLWGSCSFFNGRKGRWTELNTDNYSKRTYKSLPNT